MGINIQAVIIVFFNNCFLIYVVYHQILDHFTLLYLGSMAPRGMRPGGVWPWSWV